MAAVYDRKFYIGKVLGFDDSDPKISFYEHAATLGSISRESKKGGGGGGGEIWVDVVNILCVVLVSAETKREKKIEKFVLENAMEKFSAWKNKNWRFALVLYCTRYSM